MLNFRLLASPERQLMFDINDFDETLPGPWEWDVKRLSASLVIAARANGSGRAAGDPPLHAAEEIDFDVDLRELQGQERLDVFCSFGMGRRLGKPVLMNPARWMNSQSCRRSRPEATSPKRSCGGQRKRSCTDAGTDEEGVSHVPVARLFGNADASR
jgi:hypothetical protein